jgi:hypothetical protein
MLVCTGINLNRLKRSIWPVDRPPLRVLDPRREERKRPLHGARGRPEALTRGPPRRPRNARTIPSYWQPDATAAVSPKLKALLAVAGRVQKGGRNVTGESIAAARAEGATDVEIHDTVLIASAFCMYNRYVDGLGTFAPTPRPTTP